LLALLGVVQLLAKGFEAGTVIIMSGSGLLALGSGLLAHRLRARWKPEPAERWVIPPVLRFIWVLMLGLVLVLGSIAAMMWLDTGIPQAFVPAVALVLIPAALIILAIRGKSDKDSAIAIPETATPVIIFRKSVYGLFMIIVSGGMFLLGFAASVVFFVGSLKAILVERSSAWIIAGISLFIALVTGWGLLNLYRQVRNFRFPLVLLDKDGVHVWTDREELVPWTRLRSAEIEWIGKTEILVLGVGEPENDPADLSHESELDVRLNLFLLKGWSKDLVRAIRGYSLYGGRDAVPVQEG
jgi:hypothetical protein